MGGELHLPSPRVGLLEPSTEYEDMLGTTPSYS